MDNKQNDITFAFNHVQKMIEKIIIFFVGGGGGSMPIFGNFGNSN